jgi:hypothetical protein
MAWDVRNSGVETKHTMPSAKMMNFVDVFLKKPFGTFGTRGTLIPFILQNYLTIPIIERLGFESVYSSSGDIFIGKPEGFEKLYNIFEPYDLLPYWYSDQKFGTMIYFAKTKALRLIFDYIVENFENFPPREAEFMVMEAIKHHNLSFPKYMKKNHGYHLALNQKDVGMFCETMGLRHIHREYKDRKNLEMEIDEEFVDKTYLQ